jgi:Tfp pilus assembly protein PilX
MKGFWLIVMLIGLLLTGWLVLQDMQAKRDGAHGSANFQAVERTDRARQAVDAANKAQERLLEKSGRD